MNKLSNLLWALIPTIPIMILSALEFIFTPFFALFAVSELTLSDVAYVLPSLGIYVGILVLALKKKFAYVIALWLLGCAFFNIVQWIQGSADVSNKGFTIGYPTAAALFCVLAGVVLLVNYPIGYTKIVGICLMVAGAVGYIAAALMLY